MVAALVNCGGSGDSSSDTRQRNSALEECLPGDPNETTTTIENDPCAETTTTLYENESKTLTCDISWDAIERVLTPCEAVDAAKIGFRDGNGILIGEVEAQRNTPLTLPDGTVALIGRVQIAGLNPSFETSLASASINDFTWIFFDVNTSQSKTIEYRTRPQETSTTVADTEYEGPEVTCAVTWQTGSFTITSCDGTTGMQLQFYNEANEKVGNAGTLSENPASGIAVPDGARYLDVTIFIASAFGPENEPVGIVRLDTSTDGSNSTFVYRRAVSAPIDTTPVDTTPVDTTPVDTTPTEPTSSPRDAIANTISVQEVPCPVTYTAATRTVRLCENFDRTVGAAFDDEGKFSETVETGYGDSFVLPVQLVSGGGARYVRIATGQIMSGLEGGIPVFRGEGILDLGDGGQDVEGTIYVSPSGQEALNSGGFPDYFQVELTNAGLFDIDDIEENQFAFVTLNGKVFAEYENVKPPSNWDEGEPLAWRAYQNDGFGLPRLVGSGMLALGSSAEIDFANPFFELNSQRVELLTEEGAGAGPSGEGLSEDPCGAVDPYMITTPITPSRTNMVTLTVATDCDSADSMLGLVVYDYDNDWIPLFSQFKSTRYSTRLVATTFLADGEYDILWGDYDLVGIHEYVVNGGGSGATCHHPRLDVDAERMKATLSNCDPGGHRMRVYAEPMFWTDMDEDIRLPFKDNVIDLQMVPWDGYFEINLRIDDSFEPDFVTCVKACDTAEFADDGVETTFDASSFSQDAGVSVTSTCSAPDAPAGDGWTPDGGWAYTDLYRSAGRGAYVYEAWQWLGDTPFENPTQPKTWKAHMPDNGKILAVTGCTSWWFNEANWNYVATTKRGILATEITASMPNRPSNDRFENAPAIEPGVGAIQFTNVSATNEPGEMGIEYSNSADAGQFHSVWFKYTPEESGRASFRLTEYSFDVLMRVTSVDSEGRTILLDEAEMWRGDSFWCDCDYSSEETVSFAAKAGTTYYIQITNEDWESAVGTAILLVNGGGGETVEVPLGDETFTSASDLQQQAPTTTVPPVTTTSTTTAPAPADTVAPGSPTTTAAATPAEQGYSAARDQGSRNEVVTVLAPVGDAPATVEARKDARTVEIPVTDLYGTVSATSANVDTARSLLIRQPGRRPVRVRPSDRTVTVPVGTETTDLSIVATTTDGKSVAAPLTVKKTVAPLVKVTGTDDGGSGLPMLPVGIALAVLVGVATFFFTRRRSAAPAGDAPTED